MAALQQRSSTDTLLQGMRYRGQRIVGVFRGKGTARTLRLSNGTSVRVHRSDLHALAQLRGTEIYRAKYKGLGRAGKRLMLTRSTMRQKALHTNFLKRMKAEADAAPPGERRRLLRRLATIRKGKFGSPLTGKRPASTLWSNTRHFTTAKAAGGK